MATVAEALLGVALILGVFRRPVAWASAIVLALFAGAMTLSFGIKAPHNYSVFADVAAAFALGAWPAASADVDQFSVVPVVARPASIKALMPWIAPCSITCSSKQSFASLSGRTRRKVHPWRKRWSLK